MTIQELGTAFLIIFIFALVGALVISFANLHIDNAEAHNEQEKRKEERTKF